MTDKELHKLNRRELLQLMLDQGKETVELRQSLEETRTQLDELQSNYERLKKRLDQKDLHIRQLTETLQTERTKREIELEEAGSIAEAALRLNGVFEAAQKAAEQYIYNIRLMHDHCQGEWDSSCMKDCGEGQVDREAWEEDRERGHLKEAAGKPQADSTSKQREEIAGQEDSTAEQQKVAE